MHTRSTFIVTASVLVFIIGATTGLSSAVAPAPALQQSAPGNPPVTRSLGTIKAIQGNTITLAPDSGSEVAVAVQPNARILRLEPGEKDLKNATPIQLQDLQVGDRILVGGVASADSRSLAASVVVAMKHSDLEARQKEELQDWQKRGVDGLVKTVDPANGAIMLSIPSFGGAKEISVHTSKSTVMLRYPPGSANFVDAKPGSFADIRAGDQVHALGNRSADGSELSAEEVVSGTFRNVAGIINSVDASSGTIDVQDVLSRKSVKVKVSADSQLRKLPAEAARLVLGFKGGSGEGSAGSGANSSSGPRGNEPPASSPPGGAAAGGGSVPGGPRSGRFDLNRVVSRLPAVGLSDLHKGDAVMIVTTEGPGGDVVTKLLSGVESVLQAAPGAGQALMLAPWNLGGAPSGDNGNP